MYLSQWKEFLKSKAVKAKHTQKYSNKSIHSLMKSIAWKEFKALPFLQDSATSERLHKRQGNRIRDMDTGLFTTFYEQPIDVDLTPEKQRHRRGVNPYLKDMVALGEGLLKAASELPHASQVVAQAFMASGLKSSLKRKFFPLRHLVPDALL